MYEFTLSARRLWTLVAGLFVVGGLMFLAGILIGISLQQAPSVQNSPAGTARSGEGSAESSVQAYAPARKAAQRVVAVPVSAPTVTKNSNMEPVQRALVPVEREPYTVQLGAFRDHENAERFAQSVRGSELALRIFSGWDAGERLWHCVRMGYYPDRKAAQAAADRFMAKTGKDAIALPTGSL